MGIVVMDGCTVLIEQLISKERHMYGISDMGLDGKVYKYVKI